jgi:citrate synthase
MMYKMSEMKYEPDPRLSRALDVLFILHADHEQNCSTNAVRAVGSSQVDPYSAVAAGVRALRAAARRRERAGAQHAAARRLGRQHRGLPQGRQGRQGEAPGLRPPRLQELRPARAIIRKHLDDVYEVTGKSPLLEIATELEKRALDDEYFTSRKLYPNVDFYSGLIYEAMGLDAGMFPVMFAIPRTSGWIAQWLEMIDDPEQKIARPRQIYTGARERDYVPVGERS